MKLIDLKNNCSTSNTYIASTLYIIILNLYEQPWEFKYRTIMNTKVENQVQKEFHSCYIAIMNQMVEYETN